MDADHLKVAADIAPARQARVAPAAADHRVHGNELPDARAVHTVADRVDASDEFVADYARIDDERILAVQDVHVRAADTRVTDAHADFAGARLRLRPFAQGHLVRLLDNNA